MVPKFDKMIASTESRIQVAKAAADEANKAFDATGSLGILNKNKFAYFVFNKIGHEAIGDQTKPVKEWVAAALPVLNLKMQGDSSLRFKCGELGSVWFDVDEIEVLGIKKRVRVCLGPSQTEGYKYEIMLDTTFEKW